MIYVEARSAKQVNEACNGLVGIYPSRGIVLVPIEEMASLLQIKKQDVTITPGSWVRVRRGKYQGGEWEEATQGQYLRPIVV